LYDDNEDDDKILMENKKVQQAF